jgi:hypothetical protein
VAATTQVRLLVRTFVEGASENVSAARRGIRAASPIWAGAVSDGGGGTIVIAPSGPTAWPVGSITARPAVRARVGPLLEI